MHVSPTTMATPNWTKRISGTLAVLSFIALPVAIVCLVFIPWVRSINEPDPNGAGFTYIKQRLKVIHFPLPPLRCLFANWDGQVYIFLVSGHLSGEWSHLKMSPAATAHGVTQSSSADFNKLTSDYGFLRMYPLTNGNTIVGMVDSSGPGEGRQTSEWFDEVWNRILKTQLRQESLTK